MQVNSNKYRRKKANQAGSITVESGDTLTIASGATLNAASGSTVTLSGGTTRKVIAATTTTVLTASDSGALVTLGTAGGFDTKLPAPAAGLNFTIAVKVAPTTNYTVTTNGTTQNVIHGMVVSKDLDAAADGDATAGTAVDVITFAANKALIGDRVELVCDGTLWYAVAYASAVDGITFD